MSSSSTGPSTTCGGDPGDRDDERDAELLVVQRRAVIAAAVLVELLAVIGGEDDHRVRLALAHGRDQPADRRVGVGDLAVVAVDVAVAEREPVVPVVGLVRLEEVDPDERRAAAAPGRSTRRPDSTRLLASMYSNFTYSKSKFVVRVGLQLLRVDEEHRGRIERGRPPAVGAQHRRERLVALAGRQPRQRREVFARQHRRDRERRVRRLRVGVREARAARGQRVDVGRRRARVAVGADVVGAQRVDGDQQDVRVGAARAVGQRRQRDLGGVALGGGDACADCSDTGTARSTSAASAVRSWAA